MITGISGFGFFSQKWPFRDAKLFSKKWVAETPIFIVFWVLSSLWPSCQKRENLDTHPPKKNWLIIEKFFFWYFCVCVCFFLFFVFFPLSFLFFVFFVFLEGLRVR